MNFVQWAFQKHLQEDKPAVILEGKALSHGALRTRAHAICAELSEKGAKGNVALASENSPFFVESYFGIIASGCACVPVNLSWDKQTIGEILKTCETRVVFASEKEAAHYAKEGFEVYSETAAHGAKNIYSLKGNAQPATVAEDYLAEIIFTSGSEGKPKGVMLSHGNLAANAKSIIEYLSLKEGDVFLNVLPYHYCFGLSWLHTLLHVGGTVVLHNNFMFPGTTIDAIAKNNCTGFGGVPSNFQLLLRDKRFNEKTLPSIRFLAQAGGKLQDEYIHQLQAAFPTREIFIMYGQTEATARLSYLPAGMLSKKLGSIGKGIPGTTLSVVGDGGQPAAPGEVGEIVASGKNIMLGYWKDEESTREKLAGGVLHTGDLAKTDEDGFIYVVGRQSNFLKSGGHKVFPYEIEAVVCRVPGIRAAAVVGAPDAILGEAPVAFVEAEKSAQDAGGIISFCRKNLPTYMVPKKVVFMDSLPKNERGKVSYSKIKEELVKC
ncbi:MAG: AMP-binding protein [Candidatus Micrarchaeia archaeon]|jgi:acyl-CoA synthetase (AMP-forming)/AMP-acid ligase II